MTESIDEELEIKIELENFQYSSASDDYDKNKRLTNFLGRKREKDRLLDRLEQGKSHGGSFLIAGYRGVGKTRFVKEVIDVLKEKNKKLIAVRINLGNDGDLTSKSVLFNMVYLLHNELRTTKIPSWFVFPKIKFWGFNFTGLNLIFGNTINAIALTYILSLLVVPLIYILSFLFVLIFPEGTILNTPYFWNDHSNLIVLFVLFLISFWVLMHHGKFPIFLEHGKPL